MACKPSNLKEETQQVVQILDAKYEKTDLQSVVGTNCTHLGLPHQNKLLKLLTVFGELFHLTLGDWKTEPVSLN